MAGDLVLINLHFASQLEILLHNAGLVREVSLAEFYDIKARTSIQRAWQNPKEVFRIPEVYDPAQWNDKLRACTRGEFFTRALENSHNILDVGCGEGWPSLYLARSLPQAHITGIDLSPGHIALAKGTAGMMHLSNVTFHIGHIEALPFSNDAFDGACFGGNVFTYGFDALAMLAEIGRVLQPGSPFAFEQWPIDPQTPPHERILFYINGMPAGQPPILHYGAGSGLYDRAYFIFIKPETIEGKRLIELAGRMNGELTEEQRIACWEIKGQIQSGALELVDYVLYSGENRSLASGEFPRLLSEAGFEKTTSWALPDAPAFARSLQANGILAHLCQDDLLPFLRALIASAPSSLGWLHSWVTCWKTSR
jgi:ubiquinone/menaquinone biosynthesis C-methylase UbiE